MPPQLLYYLLETHIESWIPGRMDRGGRCRLFLVRARDVCVIVS